MQCYNCPIDFKLGLVCPDTVMYNIGRLNQVHTLKGFISLHTKILHDNRANVYINEKYIKSQNYF